MRLENSSFEHEFELLQPLEAFEPALLVGSNKATSMNLSEEGLVSTIASIGQENEAYL